MEKQSSYVESCTLMLLVDSRAGSKELLTPLRHKGLVCESTELPYADIMFEGYGSDGPITIGIEHKKLHDIMSCVEDHRYSAHQLVGMKRICTESWLMIEGNWKPHDPNATLMEGFNNGTSWGQYRERGNGGRATMYNKLYRYLISVRRAGVYLDCTRDQAQSVQNIFELYQYYQKRQHTSMIEVQKVAIPTLVAKPSLTRRWASDLTDIGVKHSLEAERIFKTPIRLAMSSEEDWVRMRGVGVLTAQRIIREIHTGKV